MVENISKRLGDWKEHFAFERQKRKSGCVIRSLESITGTRATQAEWRMRLDSMALLIKNVDVIVGNLNYESALEYLSDIDSELVACLIEQIGRRDTPMGLALRNFDVIYTKLDRNGIIEKLSSGDQVMVVGMALMGGELWFKRWGGHAMHVVLGNHSQIFVKSDWVPHPLRQHPTIFINHPVNALVFSAKRQGK